MTVYCSSEYSSGTFTEIMYRIAVRARSCVCVFYHDLYENVFFFCFVLFCVYCLLVYITSICIWVFAHCKSFFKLSSSLSLRKCSIDSLFLYSLEWFCYTQTVSVYGVVGNFLVGHRQ